MLQMLMEFMSEYFHAENKGKWVGNDRYYEMIAVFEEELNRIIDQRVKSILKSKNL